MATKQMLAFALAVEICFMFAATSAHFLNVCKGRKTRGETNRGWVIAFDYCQDGVSTLQCGSSEAGGQCICQIVSEEDG